ncbi:MAG: substrate-binding domain-containing protein [Saprospiraceae bacterium]|nr:substrate-binding domain-containing protein [Saprospiraceae bacterium]
MKRFTSYILFLLLFTTIACVRKIEDIEAPTMGSLHILADESIKDIVEQEEEIFERFYPHAHLDITYTNERDMFMQLVEDSVDVIMTTRMLTPEETNYLSKRQSEPRHFPYATSAIAFISNKPAGDTVYTYEKLKSILGDSTSGKIFVIENVKSGISQEVLQLINKPVLPGHFYALSSKKEVLEYVQAHENAIGIIDYVAIGDSDSAFTREVLKQVNLVGVSRPQDSIQYGFLKPFQYNLQDRKYPFTRELYVINNTGKSDVAIGFASFICGEIGQKIVLKAGLLPAFQTERNLEFKNTGDIKVIK